MTTCVVRLRRKRGASPTRSLLDIVRNADDHYLVSLQRRGQSRITQDDDAFALDPAKS
jgi:hypothetical protein